MFYYIYKLKENKEIGDSFHKSEIAENYFNLLIDYAKKNPETFNFKLSDQKEIDGDFSIKEKDQVSDIQFKLRSESGFVFIQTDLQRKKNKAVKLLESILGQNKLENFVPTDVNEMNFLYHVGKLNHAKFFLDDNIVTNDEVEESCIEDENCELFEASLELDIDDHRIPIYYYGDAIQFPESVGDEEVELAIQTFENAMSES